MFSQGINQKIKMTTTLYPILMIPILGLFILLIAGKKEKEIGLLTSVAILAESIRL
jgi:hypothetical protein